MKKMLLIASLLFFSISLLHAGWFEARRLSTSYYSWTYLKYEKFSTSVKAQGLFYETTLYMKVTLGRDWQGRYANSGKYEFIWTFELPEEALITSLSIYDPAKQKFVNASMVDLSTAEEDYQQHQSSTPSALLRTYRNREWNGNLTTFNQLHVSPVDRNESKELKITWLMPCEMAAENRRILLPTGQFYQPNAPEYNSHSEAEFFVSDYDNPDKTPQNIHNLSYSWSRSGDFWYSRTSSNNRYWSDNATIGVAPINSDRPFLQTYKSNDAQFYQLAVRPGFQDADIPARHLIICTDLVKNSSVADKVYTLLDKILPLAITEKDSIAFLVSGFTAERLDASFVQASTTNLKQRLQSARNKQPLLNTLPFMLRDAVAFLNEKDKAGEIWVISNATEQGYPTGAVMEIVSQTYFSAQNEVKFRIIDAATWGPYNYIDNKYYIGNQYLYENLSRLSGGFFAGFYNFADYNWSDAMLDCLVPLASSVEIDPVPQDGFSYSRIDLNRGRKNFNKLSRYYQMGMYDGEAPFELDYFGNYYEELFYKNAELQENTAVIPEECRQFVQFYWYGDYINNELLEQPQTYNTIKFIEDLAVQHHILTPYSGLVLPGSDGTIAFNKLSVKDSVASAVAELEDEVILPEKLTLSAYPNPFNPQTTLHITWPAEEGVTKAEIIIFDILGRKIRTYSIDRSFGTVNQQVVWDGRNTAGVNLASGVYLVAVKTSVSLSTIKVNLIR
ncbi:MAG: T9SS type A sorting domain-containing protein [Deferribacteres bacterium]|nr:T9SS type A sorting domain-containing protein [candidate division KSB1 bacterium]MCB9503606.1 T9SS type A sorting domain-containing protein [Deferribacteres bacterium]